MGKNNFSKEYLPSNNTYETNLTLEKLYDDYVISGKHYKTFTIDINDYNSYLNNKNNILKYIKENNANTELSNILLTLSNNDIFEKYLYQNNINYRQSILTKYIKPIKESLTNSDINISPRIRNINEHNIGNFYMHIIEDTNILELYENDKINYIMSDRYSKNRLIIYIGQYCYKYRTLHKGPNDRKIISFLETT